MCLSVSLSVFHCLLWVCVWVCVCLWVCVERMSWARRCFSRHLTSKTVKKTCACKECSKCSKERAMSRGNSEQPSSVVNHAPYASTRPRALRALRASLALRAQSKYLHAYLPFALNAPYATLRPSRAQSKNLRAHIFTRPSIYVPQF